MDFEIIAGFLTFVALIIVWAVAPKAPVEEMAPAAAPVLGKVTA